MVLIVAQFRAAYKKLKTMKEPTMEEVLELVSFWRDESGKLQISNVFGGVKSVHGSIYGDVHGKVHGSVGGVYGSVSYVHGSVGYVDGCVVGDVKGNVYGDVGIVHGNVSDVFGTVWGISSNKVRDKVVELIK